MLSPEKLPLAINELDMGAIIKKMRKILGMHQEDLARVSLVHRTTISHIENGRQDCTDEIWLDIKTGLDVEHLPLFEDERYEFKTALHRWYDVISERNWEQAQKLCEHLSVIKLLPHDVELNTLFSLFECRLQIAQKNLEPAEKTLVEFDLALHEPSETMLYHYNYNRGTLNYMRNRFGVSLDFYLKTLALSKPRSDNNDVLYFAISRCYDWLGYYAKSITFLNAAIEQRQIGKNNVPEFHLYNNLGRCYATIGCLDKADKALRKALAIAKKIYAANENAETRAQIGLVYINYALIFRNAKRWRRAIEYVDMALDFFEHGTDYELNATYQKLRCSIQIRRYAAYGTLLDETIERTKDNDTYSILFQTLKDMTNIDDQVAKHLETVIVPELLAKSYMFLALDCCEFLISFYETQSRSYKQRSAGVLRIIHEITSRMREGCIIE